MSFNGTDLEPSNLNGGECTVDGVVNGRGSVETIAASEQQLSFRIRLHPSANWQPGRCFSDLADVAARSVVVPIDFEQLMATSTRVMFGEPGFSESSIENDPGTWAVNTLRIEVAELNGLVVHIAAIPVL